LKEPFFLSDTLQFLLAVRAGTARLESGGNVTAYELTYVFVIVIVTYRGFSNALIFFRDRRLDFLAFFSLAQFAFAFYLLCVLNTINVTPSSALIWERVENASLPVMALFFLLFTHHFRPVLPEWAVWILCGLDALLSVVILFYPHAYTEALSAPRTFPFLGITLYETVQPVWVAIFLFSNLLGMSAIVVRYLRMAGFAARNLRFVLLSLILFFLMGASDMAVSLRFYDMPYIAHAGFLLVMFAVEGLFEVEVKYPHGEKAGTSIVSENKTQRHDPGTLTHGNSPEPDKASGAENPAPGSAIFIRVLGPLRIESQNGPAIYREISNKRKMLKLFKLLILSAERGVHREEVIEALWAEQPAASAANNLHALVFRLRKLFGNQDVLEFAEDRLRLKSDTVRVDAALLEEVLGRAQNAARSENMDSLLVLLEEARRLYAGDFFEFDPYFEGAEQRRESISRAYRKVLMHACTGLSRTGRHELILPLAEQAVRLERTDEEAWRFLLASLIETGRRGEAQKKFEELTRILKKELEIEPDEETRKIIQRIRTG
jgi:DNA-binding SARP family transcriptional activator